MRKPVVQKWLFIVAALVAVVLLLIGGRRTYKVYDADTEDFGLVVFHRISDRQLVIDATFSGVTRRGRKLYSTYDRTEARAKRTCPT